MVTFHVPTANTAEDQLVFKVPERAILVAGSRHGAVALQTAGALVKQLNQSGFGLLVGCARSVDECFRNAASHNEEAGLTASVVVPDGLSAAAALRRRTLWMVKRSVLLILFPDDPTAGHWGKGSRLAYTAALYQ